MVTAGVLSILYIYAMANFATCIAYTVIAIIELFIIVYILIGLIGTKGQQELAVAGAEAAVSAVPTVVKECAKDGSYFAR